jgi:hypothetical protein
VQLIIQNRFRNHCETDVDAATPVRATNKCATNHIAALLEGRAICTPESMAKVTTEEFTAGLFCLMAGLSFP